MKKKIITSLIFGLLLGNATCLFAMKEKEDKLTRDFTKKLVDAVYDEGSFDFLKEPKYRKFIKAIIKDPVEKGQSNTALNILFYNFNIVNKPKWADAVIFLIKNGANRNYPSINSSTGEKMVPLEYVVKLLDLALMNAVIAKTLAWQKKVDYQRVENVINVLCALIRKKPKMSKEAQKRFEEFYPGLKKYLKKQKANKLLNKKLEEINKFFKGKETIRQKDFEERTDFLLSLE